LFNLCLLSTKDNNVHGQGIRCTRLDYKTQAEYIYVQQVQVQHIRSRNQ
jgi:hypothetical protein